jgi:hypothetical protein
MLEMWVVMDAPIDVGYVYSVADIETQIIKLQYP